MDNLLKNKKIVIICVSLVVVLLVVYLVINKDKNIEYSYDNDESISYLKSYGVNEYIPVYVDESDIVVKYFNEFRNAMISNVDLSYELLNEKYRNAKFGSIDKYKEYLNNIISLSTYSSTVEVYKVIYSDGDKYFDVYDTDGYHYIFKENSIMNYEVYLDNYTIKIG